MELFGEFDVRSLWPVFGMLLLCGFLLRRGYGRLGRRTTDRPSRSGLKSNRLERPRQEADAEAQFARWEVKMHEVSRELSAQLDSKMIALEQLIRMADETLARSDRIRHQSDVANAPSAEAARAQLPISPPHIVTSDAVQSHAASSETAPETTAPVSFSSASSRRAPSRRAPLHATHEHSQAAALAARARVDDEYVGSEATMTERAPACETSTQSVPATDDGNDDGSDSGSAGRRAALSDDRDQPRLRTAEVYALADSGLSSDEIARQTGSLVGEVELILSLRSER